MTDETKVDEGAADDAHLTQLATRLLGSVGKVDAQKLRTGRLDASDWDRLGTALGKLNEAPLLIDETPGLNPLELRARARLVQRG